MSGCHAPEGFFKFLLNEDNKLENDIIKLELRMLELRMDDLENKISEKYAHPCVIGRIEKLEKERDLGMERIKRLEEKWHDMVSMPNIFWAKYNKTPHRCPVCDGNKTHKRMMMQAGQMVWIEDNCICCEGKGIVWG